MKRIIVLLMVLLLACISSFAQDPGKLLHSEIYHEIDRYEFYGEVSVSERDLRMDIYENEIIPYNLNGNRFSRAKMLFQGLDSDGNRVYQTDAAGHITYFTVLKDWDITASQRYSYSKGIDFQLKRID